MALCDATAVGNLLTGLNVVSGLLAEMAAAADAAVKRYCGRRFETETLSEYYSGQGNRDLLLRQWPVDSVGEVRMDALGAWGQATGSFDATTVLTAGADYALVLDDTPGSRCGLLRRLGLRFGSVGFSYANAPRSLSGGRAAAWPPGDGNVKVTYTAGWDSGSLPADLKHAAALMGARLYQTRTTGGQLYGGERLGEYGYNLLASPADDQMGGIRQLLAPYMDRPL